MINYDLRLIIRLENTQNKPRELELSLYFSHVLTINLRDKWLEKTADLPRIVQQHLSAIDAILTICCAKGLCAEHSLIVLGGIDFFDPDLQTYANRYVYHNQPDTIKNRSLIDKQLPRFTNVLYQQEYVIVHIQGIYHQAYKQMLSALLQENGIHEMQPQHVDPSFLNNTYS